MMVRGISRPTLMAIKPKLTTNHHLNKTNEPFMAHHKPINPSSYLPARNRIDQRTFYFSINTLPQTYHHRPDECHRNLRTWFMCLPNSIWVDLSSTQILYEGMDFSQKGIQPDHETSSRLEMLRLIQQYGQ